MCLLAAIVGVVVAHAGGYIAAFPHTHSRDAHLAETGHSYWPAASVLAVAAAVVLLLVAASSGIRRGRAGDGPLTLAAGRLALVQVLLFAGIEIVERIPNGLDVASLLGSREFVVGVLLQFAVAALVCRGTRAVEQITARVVARRQSIRTRAATHGYRRVDGWRRALHGPLLSLGSRAPPSFSYA